jgi:hypothetical protein
MHIYPKWADERKVETDDVSRKLTAEKIRSVLIVEADPHTLN